MGAERLVVRRALTAVVGVREDARSRMPPEGPGNSVEQVTVGHAWRGGCESGLAATTVSAIRSWRPHRGMDQRGRQAAPTDRD